MSAEMGATILKRELRKRVRAALRALPTAEIQRQSTSLCARLAASRQYERSSTIALYSSMPGELDTSVLIVRAFADGKRVFLPRVTSKVGRTMVMLEARSVDDVASWARSDWGISEPPVDDGRDDAPEDSALDLIVVPGVAFDVRGGRCGQGMGFYDTYFARYQKKRGFLPALVALALEPQVVAEVPMTDLDVRVDELLRAERD